MREREEDGMLLREAERAELRRLYLRSNCFEFKACTGQSELGSKCH